MAEQRAKQRIAVVTGGMFKRAVKTVDDAAPESGSTLAVCGIDALPGGQAV